MRHVQDLGSRENWTMDKRILATAATVIVALSAAPALADTINFGQLGRMEPM